MEEAMTKFVIALAAAATVATASMSPASAQVYFGAGPGGAEIGIGGGPYYHRHHRYYGGRAAYGAYYDDYASCRVVKTRVHTPSGAVVVKTRRVC
jgi:hypothetical protein